MIAFLGASALSYPIEGNEPFSGRVRSTMLELARGHPGIGIAVSRFTWLERRVGPMKKGDAASLSVYDAFFARQDLVWVELTREVVDLATAVRVRHGLHTPDALQAACCLQLGPDHVLLTGDAAFQRVAGLNVQLLA